jgi:predicted  nucleic acid-binding Zn-ribbon protein
LDERRTEITTDEETLASMKSAIEELQVSFDEANAIAKTDQTDRESHLELLEICHSALAKDLENIARTNKDRDKYTAQLQEVQKTIAGKQETLTEAEEYFKTMTEETEEIKSKIFAGTQRIQEIETRLPTLDEEKKS